MESFSGDQYGASTCGRWSWLRTSSSAQPVLAPPSRRRDLVFHSSPVVFTDPVDLPHATVEPRLSLAMADGDAKPRSSVTYQDGHLVRVSQTNQADFEKLRSMRIGSGSGGGGSGGGGGASAGASGSSSNISGDRRDSMSEFAKLQAKYAGGGATVDRRLSTGAVDRQLSTGAAAPSATASGGGGGAAKISYAQLIAGGGSSASASPAPAPAPPAPVPPKPSLALLA